MADYDFAPWISVELEQPPFGVFVLAAVQMQIPIAMVLARSKHGWYDYGANGDVSYLQAPVSHWMRIPALPVVEVERSKPSLLDVE